MENMLAHGSDVVYVPMFFDRRETVQAVRASCSSSMSRSRASTPSTGRA
jgi:hypothetical protein